MTAAANSASNASAPSSARRPSDFPRIGEAHARRSGTNYSLVTLGPTQELTRYGVRHPAVGQTIRGKVFLHQLLDLTGMEISFGLLPAGAGLPFYHKHQQNEEVYLFFEGRGEFQVDGEVMPIDDGTAIRVAPEGVRCVRNTGDKPLFYVVIQAKQGSLEQWTGSDGVGVPGEVQWPG